VTILGMITKRKAEIEELGHSPVRMQPWEQDDDGLMYANSLLEQLEDIQSNIRREVAQ
jgi:hypothetical protein